MLILGYLHADCTNDMKKIGIILNSTDCSKYLYQTVGALAESKRVELFFLLNADVASSHSCWKEVSSRIRAAGTWSFMEWALFKIITVAEYKFLSIFSKRIRRCTEGHHKTLSIEEFNNNDITYLHPIHSTSGLIVRYPDDDIANIKSLNLDLVIRGNAPGIFKGEILNSAREGVISFHHGDNRWNRGLPPAFWEVYLRKPSTGFIIQILTEELDGGLVLFRGEVATCRTFTENLVKILEESNPYLARIVLEYAMSGRLPLPEARIPFGGRLYTNPSFAQSIKYLMQTGMLFLDLIMNRFILRRHERWGVAFISGSWRDASLRKGFQVTNPPNRYFADPFVVTRDNRTICFVEDYCFMQQIGCISAVEILDDNCERKQRQH